MSDMLPTTRHKMPTGSVRPFSPRNHSAPSERDAKLWGGYNERCAVERKLQARKSIGRLVSAIAQSTNRRLQTERRFSNEKL
jgi:hypothetical protein